MKKILLMLGIVLALGGAACADLLAPPKEPAKERTITGKLMWGSDMKDRVWLKSAKGGVIQLGMLADLPKTIEYDKLIGQQVEAKVMAQRTTGHKGAEVLLIKNVKAIKATTAAGS